MNVIPQSYVDNAVLYKLFEFAQQSDNYLMIGEIADLFDFKISPKRVDLALQNLEAESWVARRLTPGEPATITAKGYKVVERQLSNSDTFMYRYASYGDEWLQQRRLVVNGVPASDRIVTKTDNSDVLNEIVGELDNIEKALNSSNEVGLELGDDRDLIQAEISAAKSLVKEPRFRLRRVLDLLLPALKYLGEKFSGAAIGEAAKHLIKLLLGLT